MTFEFGNGADRKKQRQRRIVDTVKGANGITTRSLVGFCVVHLGLKRKTAERYIQELFDFGVIYKRGDKYYVRKSG